MAFVLVIWAFSVLAVQGAVLSTEDTLLKRIARSPGCDKCSGPHLPPPPPPKPRSIGKGPPSPPLGAQASSSAFSSQQGGFKQNGFQSGSSASASGGVSGGYNQNTHLKPGFSGNLQGQGGQNGFKSGASATAQSGSVAGYNKNAYNPGFSGKQLGGGGYQQNGFKAGPSGQFGGAISNLGGAQGTPGNNGCSTCGKGNSALSNAKSNSGSATAIAVNG